MKLAAFVSENRRQIFSDLTQGIAPSVGIFDESQFREGKAKGQPQMGSVRYDPVAVYFEFIYPSENSISTVLTIKVDAPSRIVFLPVPNWVVENIWQGDVTGTYHFEDDALQLLEELKSQLSREENARLFGPQPAKRRE